MEYYTRFYWFCPEAEKEIYVEAFLFRDEAPADRVEYWGQIIALPATNEWQITVVFRDGKKWDDYPDIIEKEIYSQSWECSSKRA